MTLNLMFCVVAFAAAHLAVDSEGSYFALEDSEDASSHFFPRSMLEEMTAMVREVTTALHSRARMSWMCFKSLDVLFSGWIPLHRRHPVRLEDSKQEFGIYSGNSQTMEDWSDSSQLFPSKGGVVPSTSYTSYN